MWSPSLQYVTASLDDELLSVSWGCKVEGTVENTLLKSSDSKNLFHFLGMARREERLRRSKQNKSSWIDESKAELHHEPNWLNWVRLMWSAAFDPVQSHSLRKVLFSRMPSSSYRMSSRSKPDKIRKEPQNHSADFVSSFVSEQKNKWFF